MDKRMLKARAIVATMIPNTTMRATITRGRMTRSWTAATDVFDGVGHARLPVCPSGSVVHHDETSRRGPFGSPSPGLLHQADGRSTFSGPAGSRPRRPRDRRGSR